MGERLRETGHVAAPDRICPGYGAKGTIEFQQQVGKQMDLFGRSGAVFAKRTFPWCRRCRRSFPRDQEWEWVR